MNPDVLRYLRCPLCEQPLAPNPGTGPAGTALCCPRGHSYDTARQGYVNLLPGRSPHDGDTVDMVAARSDFLHAGHYDPISSGLAEAARRVPALVRATDNANDAQPAEQAHLPPPLVVDVGAGTGRHLAAVLDTLPGAVGLALDVSKPALRRAARAHLRAGAARCDTWRGLPVADGSAALLLNVFAPRNGPEFRRVLRPDGALLVVTPLSEHLAELVDRLGLLRVDRAKEERVSDRLAGEFVRHSSAVHRWCLRLDRTEVRTLVNMGPSAWHIDPAQLAERIGGLPEPVVVTAAVQLATYHPS